MGDLAEFAKVLHALCRTCIVRKSRSFAHILDDVIPAATDHGATIVKGAFWGLQGLGSTSEVCMLNLQSSHPDL